MKKIWLVLCAAFLFSTAMSVGFASGGVSSNKESAYNIGRDYFSWGMYREAMEAFQKSGSYKDSVSWAKYTEGFVEIEEADGMEEKGYLTDAETHIGTARRLFQRLSTQSFEDSANMEKYCRAREFHMTGKIQSALDLYAEIPMTMDSWERYDDITSGKALPTQAPVSSVPDRFLNISAYAVKKMNTYMGPGSMYQEQKVTAVRSGTEFSICAKEENYYLIEIETEKGRIRCWGPTLFIHREEKTEVPDIGKGRKAYIIEAVEGTYGPGEEYLKTGIILPDGLKVTAYTEEGHYTMVEFTLQETDRPARVWVPTSSFR